MNRNHREEEKTVDAVMYMQMQCHAAAQGPINDEKED